MLKRLLFVAALLFCGAASQAFAANNGTVCDNSVPAICAAPWTAKLGNALSTTVLSINASAGQLGMVQCYNPNSSQVYIQVFNVASGSVTLGSTTPAFSVPIAATSTGGFVLPMFGVNFSTAISAAATTTATGSTAPSTAADCNFAYH